MSDWRLSFQRESSWLEALVEARAESAFELRSVAASAAERRVAVDETWGDGLPTLQKLALFDRFWVEVDRRFAAFQGIEVDWAGLRARYRAEIERGVSAGRFAGIMSALSLQLRESHSLAIDLSISARTWPEPGIPLFVQGGWMQDFSGTCVTAASDGTALVYRAARNHPLGLRAGDRIARLRRTSLGRSVSRAAGRGAADLAAVVGIVAERVRSFDADVCRQQLAPVQHD